MCDKFASHECYYDFYLLKGAIEVEMCEIGSINSFVLYYDLLFRNEWQANTIMQYKRQPRQRRQR